LSELWTKVKGDMQLIFQSVVNIEVITITK